MSEEVEPTHPSLLFPLREARNAEACDQFVEVYAPLICGFCRRHGLEDASAADVSQEVMRAVTLARLPLESTYGFFRVRSPSEPSQ